MATVGLVTSGCLSMGAGTSSGQPGLWILIYRVIPDWESGSCLIFKKILENFFVVISGLACGYPTFCRLIKVVHHKEINNEPINREGF